VIDECLVVEFRVEGDDCPLADATRDVAATIDARPPQLRNDGYALLRFSAPADADLAPTLDADDRIRYLHVSRSDSRRNFRCLSKHPCVVHELVSAGFMVESLRYRGGDARLTGAVVGHDVLRGVMEAAGETVGVRLERVYPLGSEDDAAVATRWDVTPKQSEALRAALELGYFAVPREATASEVADALGVSKSAFLERLRRAQASVFADLFET
jgi:predicted DNA binding protein